MMMTTTMQETVEVARAAMSAALLPHVGRKVTVRFAVENAYIWYDEDGQDVPVGAGVKDGRLVLSGGGNFFLMPPRARKHGHHLCVMGSPSTSWTGSLVYVAEVLDATTGSTLYVEARR